MIDRVCTLYSLSIVMCVKCKQILQSLISLLHYSAASYPLGFFFFFHIVHSIIVCCCIFFTVKNQSANIFFSQYRIGGSGGKFYIMGFHVGFLSVFSDFSSFYTMARNIFFNCTADERAIWHAKRSQTITQVLKSTIFKVTRVLSG